MLDLCDKTGLSLFFARIGLSFVSSNFLILFFGWDLSRVILLNNGDVVRRLVFDWQYQNLSQSARDRWCFFGAIIGHFARDIITFRLMHTLLYSRI